MSLESGIRQADVNYYIETTRELVTQLNPLEPDEWRSCNRLCGQIWDAIVASRYGDKSVDYSTKNSSVPRKILKFAMSPEKYVWEMRLIHALSRDEDVSMLRIKYEKTFGEPLCTFTDDGRVKIVLDVMDCAWRRAQTQLFARSLVAVGQSPASDHTTITENAPEGVVERFCDNGGPEIADEKVLNDTLLETARLELRLKELLDNLRELDPTIARIAEKYAYGC